MRETSQPVFTAFNRNAPVNIYRRNLPHWRQDGATYFVTFRLGDSIPKSVVRNWEYEDVAWMKAHGIEGPLTESTWCNMYNGLPQKCRSEYERRKARRLHVELDKCYGGCLLRKKYARKTVEDALKHFHGSRWRVGDFIIMPNHIHGLFLPFESYALERILQSVKGFVADNFRKKGITTGRLWQKESYDRIVRDREELRQWRKYICENPGKAKLGDKEYTYHRCSWLDEKRSRSFALRRIREAEASRYGGYAKQKLHATGDTRSRSFTLRGYAKLELHATGMREAEASRYLIFEDRCSCPN